MAARTQACVIRVCFGLRPFAVHGLGMAELVLQYAMLSIQCDGLRWEGKKPVPRLTAAMLEKEKTEK